jgi:hypothetical protein
MKDKEKRNLLIAALTLVLAVMGTQVHAMETGAYQAPDIGKFLLIGEEDGDGDGDGVKETHILRYRNVAGDGVFSMTTKDRLWAWSLESHSSGGEAAPERNYVIRDSDCDGTFDERYRLDEQFHVPDCLK